MKLNLGMDLDEASARKMMGLTGNIQGGVYDNFAVLDKRLRPEDLKYNTPKDLEEDRFELTETEARIHRILSMEHDTLDIIN